MSEALRIGDVLPSALARTLFKLKQAQITADRHADRITSFEQWSASRAQ